jgi:hypothetical protein
VINGTSAAAAFVSGAAALLYTLDPDLRAEDVRKRLIDAADQTDGLAGLCEANGRLNVGKAVAKLRAELTGSAAANLRADLAPSGNGGGY